MIATFLLGFGAFFPCAFSPFDSFKQFAPLADFTLSLKLYVHERAESCIVNSNLFSFIDPDGIRKSLCANLSMLSQVPRNSAQAQSSSAVSSHKHTQKARKPFSEAREGKELELINHVD
jgi:hypothetical protein